MKKRVIIATVVSFVLLLAVILAGLNAIFTVTNVKLSARSYSADGEREAYELQEKLKAFEGDSSLFLDENKIRKTVAEYPCFLLENIEKAYPDEVFVTITERKEAYAFPLKSGKYAVFDEEGGYLYEKDTDDNRSSGKNIQLIGFDFTVSGGEVKGEYFEELITMFSKFRSVLGEVRANILSVTLVHGGDTSATQIHYFRIAMREGVYLDLYNPHIMAGEKALLAVQLYAGVGDYAESGLKDGEKVSGVVTVMDIEGKLQYDYQNVVD